MVDLGGVEDPPTAEMEAVGEVFLGENRAANTIINEEQLVEGLHRLSSSSQSIVQHEILQADGATNSEESSFDFILTPIMTFIARLLFPHEYVVGDELRRFLTDAEIDQLALFQGNSVAAYMEELEASHGRQVPSEKRHQIQAFLEDDEFIEWERRCIQLMPSSVLHSHFIKQLEGHRAKLRAYLGSWSSSQEHCSTNIYLLDDQLTAHRIPVVNHTDAIRGKFGVSKGVHAWDIKVAGPLGTHCSIGVTLGTAPLMSSAGYISIIGDNDSSWGWDLVWGNVSHGGKVLGNFPSSYIYDYTPGDTIRLILNCDKRELCYAVNDMAFGTAFVDLQVPRGAKLYPSVGLCYGNIEVSMIYLGTPPPLRDDICSYRECDD